LPDHFLRSPDFFRILPGVLGISLDLSFNEAYFATTNCLSPSGALLKVYPVSLQLSPEYPQRFAPSE
jgi:hypothetical protein